MMVPRGWLLPLYQGRFYGKYWYITLGYGLTDSGIISLVKGKYLALSDDFPLVGYLQSKDIDAINFNHLRPSNW